ncbi:syndetin-like protein isoform X1, partial [Tanacetum coccineum]
LAGKRFIEIGFNIIGSVQRLQRSKFFNCEALIYLFDEVVDAYALIGDVSGLAEKIQSFFMQEVISETHNVLKIIMLQVCSFMLYDLDFEPLSLSLSSMPSCDLVSLTNILILCLILKASNQS